MTNSHKQTVEERLNEDLQELEQALVSKQALKRSLPESVLKMKWSEFSKAASSCAIGGLY